MAREKPTVTHKYIHLTYHSRAFEWVRIKPTFLACLEHLELQEAAEAISEVIFGWRHVPSIASIFYQPKSVFYDFSVDEVLQARTTCVCHQNRFRNFLDPGTLTEQHRADSKLHGHTTSKYEYMSSQDSSDTKVIMQQHRLGAMTQQHVRTADLSLIHDKTLRQAIGYGLNHIPLQPTHIQNVIQEVMLAWEQVVNLLQISRDDADRGMTWITDTILTSLQRGLIHNIGRHRHSQDSVFSSQACTEIPFLLKSFYIAGLDKASNNVCIMCIEHIRIQAVQRLQEKDFEPCHQTQQLETIVDRLQTQLAELVPEVVWPYSSLPYMMAIYKMHKGKYRWITNAAQCLFSGVTSIITQALNLLVIELKGWAQLRTAKFRSGFFRAPTNIYWVIDSMFEFVLNLPENIHGLFMADITCCYESIPLSGDDNLLEAITYTMRLAFRHHATVSHEQEVIWIHIDPKTAKADKAKWSQKCPGVTCWLEFSQERLIALQAWVISNCFLRLGDKVWRQCTGIPMGFSCSPLWCNLYFVAYEIQFILRLAKLSRYDLMPLFQYSYRYIDDLCVLNNPEILLFLDPKAHRIESNPYWIYPLHLVEIKPEIDTTRLHLPGWGLTGHFLNVHLTVLDFNTGCHQTTKYDKRRHLPFRFQQYIQFKSNRPVNQAYNITVSQMVPILYMASSAELAMTELSLLADTLSNNGFTICRIKQLMLRFCTQTNLPGLRFDISGLISMLRPYLYKRSLPE